MRVLLFGGLLLLLVVGVLWYYKRPPSKSRPIPPGGRPQCRPPKGYVPPPRTVLEGEGAAVKEGFSLASVARAGTAPRTTTDTPIGSRSYVNRSISNPLRERGIPRLPAMSRRVKMPGVSPYMLRARKLRILERVGAGRLSFSQIQVFNADGVNVARGKPVKVSATAAGNPSSVVDGSTEVRPAGQAWVGIRGTESVAFLEIDFGAEEDITYAFFISGPVPGDYEGIRFQFQDAEGTITQEDTPITSELYQYIPYCFDGIAGRYVVIRSPKNGYMSFRQIEVYDTEATKISAPIRVVVPAVSKYANPTYKYENKKTYTLGNTRNVTFSDTSFNFEVNTSVGSDPSLTASTVVNNNEEQSMNAWSSPVPDNFICIDLEQESDIAGVVVYKAMVDPIRPITDVKVEIYSESKQLLASGTFQAEDSIQIMSFLFGVPKRSYNNRTLPVDPFYDMYENQQYEVKPLDVIKMEREQIPSTFGYELGKFDAQILEIPWDADNKSYLPSEVLWGVVGRQASLSIYEKVFDINLQNNIIRPNANTVDLSYKSPMFGVKYDDPTAAAGVQFGEMLLYAVAGEIVEEPAAAVKMATKWAVKFGRPAAMATFKAIGTVGRRLGFVALKNLIKAGVTQFAARFASQLATRKAAAIASSLIAKAALSPMLLVPGLNVAVGIVMGLLTAFDIIIPIVQTFVEPYLQTLYDANGTCPPNTKIFKQLIDNEVGYQIILNVLPGVGSLIGFLEPYFCWGVPGNPTLQPKDPMRNPEYLFDPQLSSYHFKVENTQFQPKPAEEYDPGYNLPAERENCPFLFCDFGEKVMVERMIQFYNVQARRNPYFLEDGRIEYKLITKIKGLVASSQLSCDVRCEMKAVRHDPITGDGYEEVFGCAYPNDPDWKDETDCFRRFYFYQSAADKSTMVNNKSLLTVSGCTNTDYTAIDAMVQTFKLQRGQIAVPSIPKTYTYRPKKDRLPYSIKTLVNGAATNIGPLAVGMAVGKAAGKMSNRFKGTGIGSRFARKALGAAPIVSGVGAGVGLGVAVQKGAFDPLSNEIAKLFQGTPSTQVISTVPGIRTPEQNEALEKAFLDLYTQQEKLQGDDRQGSFVQKVGDTWNVKTENPYMTLEQGPAVEQSSGLISAFNLCEKIPMTEMTCSDKRIVKTVINLYQEDNPTRRVKDIVGIEPRDIRGTPEIANACYYKWRETSYDAATNTEGITLTEKEVVMKFTQPDPYSCIYVPDEFATDIRPYKLRRVQFPKLITDTEGNASVQVDKTIYPTRIGGDAAGVTEGGALNLPFRYPAKPFRIPRPLPIATLGGAKCPARKCQDIDQVNALVAQFNAARSDRKIQKVLGGWTVSESRCDYLVEMSRDLTSVNPAGPTSVAQETLRIDVEEDPAAPCLFRRVSDGSDTVNSGTFVQLYDLDEYGYDISGGYIDFFNRTYALNIPSTTAPGLLDQLASPMTGILKRAQQLVSSLGSILGGDLETNIARPVEVAKAETDKLVALAQKYDILAPGCPNTKCSDPAILNAILTGYTQRNPPICTDDTSAGKAAKEVCVYNIEQNTMTRILKAYKSGPAQCDILFEERQEFYGSALFKSLYTTNKLTAKRIRLTETGNCNFLVSADPAAIQDLPVGDLSGQGLAEETAALTTPFVACQLNPRDPAIVAAIKAKYETQTRTTYLDNTLTRLLVSLPLADTVCDYKYYKTMRQGTQTTTFVEVYLRVRFTRSGIAPNCQYSVATVQEMGEDDEENILVNLSSDVNPANLNAKLNTTVLSIA
jgi:hypothetical protein